MLAHEAALSLISPTVLLDSLAGANDQDQRRIHRLHGTFRSSDETTGCSPKSRGFPVFSRSFAKNGRIRSPRSGDRGGTRYFGIPDFVDGGPEHRARLPEEIGPHERRMIDRLPVLGLRRSIGHGPLARRDC